MAKRTPKAKQRVPRTHGGGAWTKSQYFGFIRGALRRAATRYPVKYQVKDAARRPKPEGTPGRHRFEFNCNHCDGWFKEADTEVDHIVPAGSLRDFDDLAGFCERLFCEPDNLQLLCKKCHRTKTNEERKKK